MRKTIFALVFIFFNVFFMGAATQAGQIDWRQIPLLQGRVYDFSTNAPISGAFVTIEDVYVETDSDGRYLFPIIESGYFMVNVKAGKYESLSEYFTVSEGSFVVADFGLEPLKYHSADYDQHYDITLNELLRIIEFYHSGAYHCDADGEDGYAPGKGDSTCEPHDSDYLPSDWRIELSELLRLVQLYNASKYRVNDDSEDGFEATGLSYLKDVIITEATHNLNGYVPGGKSEVMVQINYDGDLAALAMEVDLPNGWVFFSNSGEASVKELDNGDIEFFWIHPPSSPIYFIYTINVPEGISGQQQISARILYRGKEGGKNMAISPVPLYLSRLQTDIINVSPSQTLKLGEPPPLIWVEVRDPIPENYQCYAYTIGPDYLPESMPESEFEFDGYIPIKLESVNDNRYEATYDGHILPGTYMIHMYCIDERGSHSVPIVRYQTVKKNQKRKAIIVAGGGPGDWNPLWEATLICTNYAFSALTYQGYDEDTVYYISAGSVANMDAEATSTNFENAIKTWASDAGKLFIYMVDHGGKGTFRMNKNEILQAEHLDEWLDKLQGDYSVKVVILYDACQSGSFLPLLRPPDGKERVLATSTESNEAAVFANNGADSFSYRFFAKIFSGTRFHEAFASAKKSIQLISKQRPRIDVNGNGIGSEDEDGELAKNIRISDEKLLGNDMPTIGKVSPPQTLEGTNSALLYAENVTDANGIKNVWAVIMPPDCCSDDSPETPIIPVSIELTPTDNGRYESRYEGFTQHGEYTVSMYAIDKNDFPGEFQQTTVTQSDGITLIDADVDSKIGLRDVIYMLQVMAGLR